MDDKKSHLKKKCNKKVWKALWVHIVSDRQTTVWVQQADTRWVRCSREVKYSVSYIISVRRRPRTSTVCGAVLESFSSRSNNGISPTIVSTGSKMRCFKAAHAPHVGHCIRSLVEDTKWWWIRFCLYAPKTSVFTTSTSAHVVRCVSCFWLKLNCINSVTKFLVRRCRSWSMQDATGVIFTQNLKKRFERVV